MLVMMLRTVTFVAPWRWCSSLHDRSAVVPCAVEPLLEPQQRRRDLRILVAQPLHELHRERARTAARSRRSARTARPGSAVWPFDAEQPVGDRVGFLRARRGC